MISKIISNPEPKTEKPFPKLMEHQGDGRMYVVFFESPDSGMIVFSKGDTWHLGMISKDFDSKYFADFTGTIQLQND